MLFLHLISLREKRLFLNDPIIVLSENVLVVIRTENFDWISHKTVYLWSPGCWYASGCAPSPWQWSETWSLEESSTLTWTCSSSDRSQIRRRSWIQVCEWNWNKVFKSNYILQHRPCPWRVAPHRYRPQSDQFETVCEHLSLKRTFIDKYILWHGPEV